MSKLTKGSVVKIESWFLPFIGKILRVKENGFIVERPGDSSMHKKQEFSFKKMGGLKIKVGDTIIVGAGGILIIENDNELKQAIAELHKMDINDPNCQWVFDKKMEEIKKLVE